MGAKAKPSRRRNDTNGRERVGDGRVAWYEEHVLKVHCTHTLNGSVWH